MSDPNESKVSSYWFKCFGLCPLTDVGFKEHVTLKLLCFVYNFHGRGGTVEQIKKEETKIYANRHVPKFLALPESIDAEGGVVGKKDRLIQVVKDGKTLTAQTLLQYKEEGDLTLTKPIVVEDTPKSIGMKVLSFRKRDVSVRDIADIIGHDFPVHVIDVEHQEELDGWLMADLVEYFEDEQRLMYQHEIEVATMLSSRTNTTTVGSGCGASSSGDLHSKRTSRRPRKAAEKSLPTMNRPRVLNQISLEFSKTPLSQHILSPKFVRDLDWIDHAWPGRVTIGSDGTTTSATVDNSNTDYPSVQYYCLTSAAGCYTDFHIDFGGTAVWYHIMSGQKSFCLIPPTKENLTVYEDWLCRPDQAELFLPDMIPNPTKNVFRLSLRASQTLVIPTGWIHAVYTPQDSVVLGGNFLHGMDIALQVEIHCIETRTRVQEKFRFPFFVPLNFYAGGMYLQKLQAGSICQREVDGLSSLIPTLEQWWTVHRSEQSQVKTGPSVIGAARHAAAQNQCDTVEEFLIRLKQEHAWVVKHGITKSEIVAIPAQSAMPSSLATSSKAASSPCKLKLRLKLPSRSTTGAPGGTDSTVSTPREGGGRTTPRGQDSGGFRIVVSSDAVKLSAPLPLATSVEAKKPRKPREDTDWYVDENPVPDDDDWMPSSSSKRGSSLPALATTTKRRLSGGALPIRIAPPPPPQQAPQPSPRTMMSKVGGAVVDPHQNKRPKVEDGTAKLPPAKTSTNSRQRLMKRFR
jgi:hypothetical protein